MAKQLPKCISDIIVDYYWEFLIGKSEELYNNILKLSECSSYYKEKRLEFGYDEKRQKIISKIEQNLKDGANVHYYGKIHRNVYDNIQLAYVLDQEEIVELMIPYIRNKPAYYNDEYLPLLVHLYKYKGTGYIFNSKSSGDNSVSENLYKKYLNYATKEELKDLEDYKSGTGKYTICQRKYYIDLCIKQTNLPDCKFYIQHYLNTRKFVPFTSET